MSVLERATLVCSTADAASKQANYILSEAIATPLRADAIRANMKARGLRFPSDPIQDRIALEPGWDVT